MMIPRLIGLMGAAGCGKDTTAEMMEQYLDNAWTFSFAHPLYEAVEAIFDVTLDSIPRSEKELPIPELMHNSPRKVLQTLGTEWGRRMIHEDLWVLLMHRRLQHASCEWAILSDVRFPNEAAYIKAQGGILVKIFRKVGEVRPHDSEGLDYPWDHQLLNHSALSTLNDQVKDLCAVWRNKYG